MNPSKEQIAAYADGEFEGDALRKVEAAVAADPDLQDQVDAHRALRARLSAHFAPVAEAPVPERLFRAVGSEAEVVDFAKAVRKRVKPFAPRFTWFGPALAASLVVALVGFSLSQSGAREYAEGDIATALDNQLVATQQAQAPVRILLSFRDEKGRFCRGFSSEAQSGVACRNGRGWQLGKVFGGKKPQAGEYRQAGSAEAEVLTAIQDLAQGPALDAEGERKAQRQGWRE